ncbi:hypothetical protein BDV39DRAFT_189842 [Aspergillus sergii]|uniref:Zn(2)-C6 fungal-type domain-containing protein n=1 Tax=Aspergillus sergii TaxID=1034303 RepID=A0A5N6XDX7_9EURO|nr:hypothetical protein BDV39DRAFT_189842 [Aspergillus sergii]
MLFATKQHRFRLDGTPVLSKSERIAQKIKTGVHRKSHFKSRNGCHSCKEKRVKCDEVKPTCGKCATKVTPCLYYSVRVDSLTLAGIKQGAKAAVSVPAELLHHFWAHTSRRLMGQSFQVIYRNHVLPLAISQHSLLHAILAVSARDMLYLQPSRHRLVVAFHHHCHEFVTQFQQDLLRPPSITTANLAHSNAFLMNVLAVADPSATTSSSWVSKSSKVEIDQAFSWIKVQAIHQSILHAYNDYIEHTFWYPVFEANDETSEQSPAFNPAQQGLLTFKISELCDIANRNAYSSACTNLCTLFGGPADRPLPRLFADHVKFIVTMDPDFVELLYRKDEVALLLFAMWLSQIMTIDIWWMNQRAQAECLSIYSLLMRSNHSRIRDLAVYAAGLNQMANSGG